MRRILFATLFLVQYANADDVSLPTIALNNTCAVNIDGILTPTALEGSCQWVINSDGTLNSRTINNEKIAILIGRQITDSEMKELNVENLAHCSFQSVGVKLNSANEPTSISHSSKDLLLCTELQIDKKVFYSYHWD